MYRHWGPLHAIRPIGGVEVWLYPFMTTALEGVRSQRHAPAALYPGKDPVPIVHEAGWAPGPVWTGEENLDPGIRSQDRSARSQSLYRLSYRPTFVAWVLYKFHSWLVPSVLTVANPPTCSVFSSDCVSLTLYALTAPKIWKYLLIIPHIHHRVDHVLSPRNTMFGLIHNVMFSVPLWCIVHTCTLLGSNLERGAVAGNSTATPSVNELAGIQQQFLSFVIMLGAFAKLRKATISVVMAVCLWSSNNSAPPGRILMIFHIWVFFEKSVQKIQILI